MPATKQKRVGRTCLSITFPLIVLLGSAVVVSEAESLLAAESTSGSAAGSQTVKGEVQMVAAEMWVVRDGSGKGVLLQIGKMTKVEGAVTVGDKIEAQVSPDGQVLSIKKVSK